MPPTIFRQGPFRRLPAGGGIGQLALSPDRISGLELYLDSRLGLGGVSDGGAVSTWPDQSGHSPARDAVQGTASRKPILHRTGGSITPSGAPVLTFDGVDSPNGDFMTSSNPTAGNYPGLGNGWTYFGVGRFRAYSHGIAGSTLMNDNSGLRPQMGYEDQLGTRKYYIGDEVGQKVYTTLFDQTKDRYMTWLYHPNTGDKLVELLVNQVSKGTVGPYTMNPAASAGYSVGALGNASDNACASMDLCMIAWWSRLLTSGEIAGLHAWARATWGF